MRALILEHRHHQQLLVCRHTPKTENKKRDFSYRQRKGENEERNIFIRRRRERRERRVFEFFFFRTKCRENKRRDTRERGEERDETVDGF